jgi:hypothetical protein
MKKYLKGKALPLRAKQKQRRGRGIAVPIIYLGDRKRVGAQRQAPAALPPFKRKITYFIWALGPSCLSPEKSASHRDSNSRPPAHSESLYRIQKKQISSKKDHRIMKLTKMFMQGKL